ncbi:FadR/GntR family transcriptional regulator [Ornithinicoccus halotolerans]|uniref:FadR/GntR family transcriptional regulator n=1 Tax=Ornithinicoccus halotolerans TaxID=1748220 RepID=UPI001295BE9D|nr:FadR/GntR family transcriptional regulator [Ornithinicoccus halotolerans]
MSSAAGPAPVGRVTRTRLYEQIVQQLVQHIRAAGLGPGDRLPPERELAASLGVSRATLAQALVALEVLGTISVRHGEGAVIVTRVTSPDDDALVRAVREHRSTMPDIIDARSALETRIAALAAERRTEEDLRRIDDALTLMAAQVQEGERGLEGDQAFHEAVTEAARSGVLARLMREIAALIRETRIESLSTPGRPQDSLASHREIAEAIRAQDPRAAARAMEDHITLVSDVALLRDHPDPG